MNFAPANARKPRRPSLTPMVDVVFLLLVFFMLAARFGHDGAMPFGLAGSGTAYTGPPRLIEVFPKRQTLNGQAEPIDAIVAALGDLMDTLGDAIILRAGDGADLQRLVTVMEALEAAGFTNLVLVE